LRPYLRNCIAQQVVCTSIITMLVAVIFFLNYVSDAIALLSSAQDVLMWPTISGRKSEGVLEAHINGFRFVSTKVWECLLESFSRVSLLARHRTCTTLSL
jgi:hypothetical protein